jgi:HSP20 family molecular chaperone IbpA
MSEDPYDWFTAVIASDWIEDLSAADPVTELDLLFEAMDGLSEFQYIQSVILDTLTQDDESFSGGYSTDEIIVYLSSEGEEVDTQLELVQPKNTTRKHTPGTGRRKNMSTKQKLFPKKEPLCDIIISDKEVKIITELPSSIIKEQLRVKAYDGAVQIVTKNRNRDYKRTIAIPPEADTDTGRSRFNNGILEIVFERNNRRMKKSKKVEIN